MWKEWNYYGKTDRLLLLLGVSLLVLVVGVRVFFSAGDEAAPSDAEQEAFQQEMARKDSLKRAAYPRRTTYPRSSSFTPSSRKRFSLSDLRLHPFDPNRADSAQLAAMGLPSYIVRHLVHYRQKGGRFRTPEAVGRLYGMSDSLFACLAPYLRIGQDTTASVTSVSSESVEKPSYPRQEKYPLGTVIDLNKADTTELKKIPGIGSGISKAIVGYRERLGGFYSVEQLAEVHYTTPEMQQWFTVDPSDVKRIPVNHAKVWQLKAHPYLNYFQAKALIDDRTNHGYIKNLSRFAHHKEFTGKDLERILPYLDFSE